MEVMDGKWAFMVGWNGVVMLVVNGRHLWLIDVGSG